MRVPVSWLRQYCDPPLGTAELGDALADAGLELGRIERVGVGSTDGFVVGRVLSAEQHPNADRLRVCSVDDGSGEPRTIVCGAPNVSAGQTVAVARPGALMPNGERLGEAKLRGVQSSGMILAEDEVGIGPDHSGIIVLDGDFAPGTPLAEALPIQDDVLDLEISPNRPDCLAVYGVAREVHALTGAALAEDPTTQDAETQGEDRVGNYASVEIADPDVCLRFTARVFTDVQVGPSPEWLKARLTAAGQRPIANVVDITNYVMLLTGQPLHSFDLDRVRGARLIIRRAGDGERLTTLDGVDRTLDPDVAVVADAERPSGIAGIIGGGDSEVSDDTSRVLMEAATWVGPNILRSSSRLGLRTEASARFEKQLHPDSALAAQRLAARLMVELCGARLVPGTIDEYPQPLEPRTLELRPRRVEQLLGDRVQRVEIEDILERLGFETGSGADGESLATRLADAGDTLLERLAETGLVGADDVERYSLRNTIGRLVGGPGEEPIGVTVPGFRHFDVQREADLIEEVARIRGLDRLPTTLPSRREAIGRLTASQLVRRRLEDELRDRGLAETISYSFIAPAALARLRLTDAGSITVANPLSEEQSVMRPLLLPGVLDAARHNAAHGHPAVALFESAHVYAHGNTDAPPDPDAPRGATPAAERHHLAAVLTQAAPATWRSPARPADFFAAKGLVEAILEVARVDGRVERSQHPFLHPGRQAEVFAGDVRLGFLGELHPTVASDWELDAVAVLELDVEALLDASPPQPPYRPASSYPAVVEDIAVVVPEIVPAAEVEKAVREAASETLEDVRVFDVYRGEQVGEGSKSLALRLTFRAPDRTLTDEDVAAEREAIAGSIAMFGGRLRA